MAYNPVPLSQRSRSPWRRGVVYGASGVGKTVFATGSQYYNTFIFDVDDGLDSAASFRGNAQHGVLPCRQANVVPWPVTKRQDFDEGFAWLMPRIQHFPIVVIDTATELQRLILEEVCEKFKIEVPHQAAWGVILYVMESIARAFRHMPCHVLFLAHETEREDPEVKRLTRQPAFQGAFGQQYAKHFSLICRYFVQDVQQKDPVTGLISYSPVRLLNCHKDQVTHAKDRSGGLDKFEVPNLDNMLGKMVRSVLAHGEQPEAVDETAAAA